MLEGDVIDLDFLRMRPERPAEATAQFIRGTSRLFRSRKTAFRQLHHHANAARDAKDHANAARLYEAALTLRPDDGALHVQCGHMWKEVGQLAKAEAHYLRAVLLLPGDADLRLQMGHFYKVAGRPYEALGAYRRAVEFVPGWAEATAEIEHLQGVLLTQADAPAGGAAVQAAEADARPGPASITRLSAEQLLQSGLFDIEWYGRRYSDIRLLKTDPLTHFARHGMVEGRRPGPNFDPDWYREEYPYAAATGLDPLTHYVTVGRERGYRPLGPPAYMRWVAAFDTLGDLDRMQIRDHAAAARLTGPQVVLVVGNDQTALVGSVIRSLRKQCLPATSVTICLAADCPEVVVTSVNAAAGHDKTFTLYRVGEDAADKQPAPGPIVILDAAAELREHALYMLAQAYEPGLRLIYSDEDRLAPDGSRTDPVFKPDASPELLRQVDYLGPCILLGSELNTPGLLAELSRGQLDVAGAARRAFGDGPPGTVLHLPFVLYHVHVETTAPRRTRRPPAPSPAEADLPTVSIIIPTRNKVDLLRVCVGSLRSRTDYPAERLEIIVVDNGSDERHTLDYLAEAEAEGALRIVRDSRSFNYSRLNNLAAAGATSDLLVLLNNDTEIVAGDWLRRLAAYAMQPGIGAVGPKLLYPDGTVQHAGLVLSIGGVAAHAHLGLGFDAEGAMGFAQLTHEVAAVTGACLAIRRSVFEEVGGLDEDLPVAFNDVVLCLECLSRGYRNIYAHDTWLRHYESQTRGVDDSPEKVDVFLREARYTRERFRNWFARDPYYNVNLSLEFEEIYQPAFPPRCQKPWREFARSKAVHCKILVLSSSFSEHDEIGIVAAIQCRYLGVLGHEVVAAGPEPAGQAELGAATPRRIGNAASAAVYAFEHDIDCVIVHAPPFLKVARLLSERTVTMLVDHGDAAYVPGALPGERRANDVERALALDSFTALLVRSKEAAARSGRANAKVGAFGGDRLGRWSPAVQQLRRQSRMARGLQDCILIVVGGLSTDQAAAQAWIERFAALNRYLDPARVSLVALSRVKAILRHDRVSVVNDPAAFETAQLFAAADLFLDVQQLGDITLDVVEAAALGAKVVPFALAEDETDPLALARRMSETTAGIEPLNIWGRKSAGTEWHDVLAELAATVDSLCHSAASVGSPASAMLSDRALIELSGLFDAADYLKEYPGNDAAAADPIGHYLAIGSAEGHRPSALFHSDWFVVRYAAEVVSGTNPLMYYLRQPWGPFDPNPFFSNAVYLAAHPDAGATGMAPLAHYLHEGGAPYAGPGFDPEFYRAAYPDVSEAVDPLVHFLRIGLDEGRLPVRPKPSRVDPYDLADLQRAVGQAVGWHAPAASAVEDLWSAARFCVDLLEDSASLRRRFPCALSAGRLGAFAQWLAGTGKAEFGLSDDALGFVAAAFAADIGADVLQLFLTREDLQKSHPFGLLLHGLGGLVTWLLDVEVAAKRLRVEQVRWFAIARAEDPVGDLIRTVRFSPMLQRRFPAGLTVFGAQPLAEWLGETCRVQDAWLKPSAWTDRLGAAEQVRVAYTANRAWQRAHANPFASVEEARRLLDWLGTQADLASEARAWVGALDHDAVARELAVPGITMLGHFGYPSGLRTSTESLVEGYTRLGHRVSARDVWVQPREIEPRHSLYDGFETDDITVIHVQPEPVFDTAHRRAGLAAPQRLPYRVAYWYWELDTVPAHWRLQAQQVDEIWTATRFVGDALRDRFDLPVYELMPGLELPDFVPRPRSHFGLSEHDFVFLFTFHMTSIMERKNPLGLIEAFRLTFGSQPGVRLVIKTSFGAQYPAQLRQLEQAAASATVTIIDDVYPQSDVLALMQCCDAYVSLHRSEGYGLTMAEAMLLGKPVVATGYSGNLDFMSAQTGLLVDYELKEIKTSIGPYAAGAHWAEPSVRHAAVCMRRLYDHPDFGRALGERAKSDLQYRLSHAASGRRMADRLDAIRQTIREHRAG